MTANVGANGRSRNLVLAAMIFAVAMTFIDQTIVSIAAPKIQEELGLTNTGTQWAINAYLLSLAALFAFGGRLADTVGHRKMVVLGVVIFAAASAMCGLTPKGTAAEAWIVTFRVVQGAGGAIMFPAALGIVVQTFSLNQRGRALALFFGIAGGLTAVGPVLGGYLTEWTWRAIFWVNIPVAIIALVLIAISKPVTDYRPAPVDYRGLALIVSGVALVHTGVPTVGDVGLEQSGDRAVHRGRRGPADCVRLRRTADFVTAHAGAYLPDPTFCRGESGPWHRHVGVHPDLLFCQRVRPDRTREVGPASRAVSPLLLPWIRRDLPDRRADPRSQRSQASGGDRLRRRGGGLRLVGREGHPAELLESGVARHSVRGRNGVHAHSGQYRRRQPGFPAVLRGGHGHHPDGPELRRQSGLRHSWHHPGYPAAIEGHLVADRPGRVSARAAAEASKLGQAENTGASTATIPHFIRLDFAYATRTVFYVMSGIMAAATVVAFVGLERGVQVETTDTGEDSQRQR